jgi:hypothetical protein
VVIYSVHLCIVYTVISQQWLRQLRSQWRHFDGFVISARFLYNVCRPLLPSGICDRSINSVSLACWVLGKLKCSDCVVYSHCQIHCRRSVYLWRMQDIRSPKSHTLGGTNILYYLAGFGEYLPLTGDNCQHFSHGLHTTNDHESISAAVFLIARGS